MKRSKGVTILGWVIVVATITYWIIFYRLFVSRLYLLIYNILYSALYVVVGIGILKLQSWARITLLCMVVIQTISTCHRDAGYIFESGIKRIVGVVDITGVLLMAVFVFWFLNKKSVKEQFKK